MPVVSEDLKLVSDWIREPDYADNFSADDLSRWLDKRPIAAVARLTAALSDQVARPLAEWHEDMGDVLWWKFPITEAPHVGRPDDLGQTLTIDLQITVHDYEAKPQGRLVQADVGGWPGYHTHFTPLPAPPSSPAAGEPQ